MALASTPVRPARLRVGDLRTPRKVVLGTQPYGPGAAPLSQPKRKVHHNGGSWDRGARWQVKTKRNLARVAGKPLSLVSVLMSTHGPSGRTSSLTSVRDTPACLSVRLRRRGRKRWTRFALKNRSCAHKGYSPLKRVRQKNEDLSITPLS